MNRETEEFARRMVGYFSTDILAAYRNQSHRYEVRTDYFEGTVCINDRYYQTLAQSERAENYVRVRLGFRGRANGELAVAAWLPDLEKCSDSEKDKWRGMSLPDEEFPPGPDPRFELWVRRYLEGDWGVESGVLSRLSEEVTNLNALTEAELGERLFEFNENPSLIFPTAENDHAYQDAHAQAYAYLIDGLRKEPIQKLGLRLRKKLNLANDNTVQAIKKVLPQDLHEPVLDPLDVVSGQRRLANHKVRPPAQPFQAFERFRKDMEKVLNGLECLRTYLEGEFKVDAQKCRDRQSKLSMLPKINGGKKPEPHYSICQLPVVEGKTIKRVEFGFRESAEHVHASEAIILHFTDGSILGIDSGSNAMNLAIDHHDLRAEEFHVDFAITYVPPLS